LRLRISKQAAAPLPKRSSADSRLAADISDSGWHYAVTEGVLRRRRQSSGMVRAPAAAAAAGEGLQIRPLAPDDRRASLPTPVSPT